VKDIPFSLDCVLTDPMARTIIADVHYQAKH